MKKKTSKQVLKKSPKVKKDTDSVGTVESVLSIIDPSIAEPIKTPEVTRKLKPKEKIHYVNSREFEEEIRAYYKSGDVSIKLGESITKIAHGLSFAPNFINYSYKEEMIGDAIIKMITALTRQRFKCKSGYNPFSYFTKVAYRAFQNRIKKEKKEHDTINRYQNEVYSLLTESGQIPVQKNTKFDTEYDDSYRTENQ
jgi:hypothetical protein